MHLRRRAALAIVALAALLAACSDEVPGREIAIVAERDTCTPARASAAPGERLTLRVENRTNGDRILQGVEGAALAKLEIGSGETRSAPFTMPQTGSARLTCGADGGASTHIEIAPASP